MNVTKRKKKAKMSEAAPPWLLEAAGLGVTRAATEEALVEQREKAGGRHFGVDLTDDVWWPEVAHEQDLVVVETFECDAEEEWITTHEVANLEAH